MSAEAANVALPDPASCAPLPPTVVLFGGGNALEAIGADLSERGVQAVFVPNSRYLAGAAALYDVIAVIGARPGVADLGGVVRAMADAGLYAHLIAFIDAAKMHLLLGSSFATVECSRGLQVIAAALRSPQRR